MAKSKKISQKKLIGAIIGFFVIVIAIYLILNGVANNQEQVANEPQTQAVDQDSQAPTEELVEEENVEIINNDTKLNVSSVLKQDKTIDGLVITNIQLTSKNGVSQLLADVKNNSSSQGGDFPVVITAVDKEGNEIIKIHGYISPVGPGATTQLSSSITDDYANAYDFKIEKE